MRRGYIGLVLLTAMAISSASADHALTEHPKILWNVKEYPTPPDTFPQTMGVWAVEFSPDGEKIIAAGWEGSIKFLNRSDGAVGQTIVAHTGNVYSVSISKDGLLLASGGADGMLNLWRVSDRTLLRSIHAHTTAVHGVALSQDASLVISGTGFDKQLKIWRTADGELLRSIEGAWGPGITDDEYGMRSVAFSPDGQYVAASGLAVWRVDGTVVAGAGGMNEAARTHVKFTPDSTSVFATHLYGVLGYVFADGTAIEPRCTFTSPPFAISPDGRSLVNTSPGNASSSSPSFIWAVLPERAWWQEPNHGEIFSYICADGDCRLGFSSLAFDPRMRTVAAGAFSGEVLLLELPIWISGIQRNGNQVNLQWQGGSGDYQLQKLTPAGAWQDIGGPLTNNAASVNIDSSLALLRVRNVVHPRGD